MARLLGIKRQLLFLLLWNTILCNCAGGGLPRFVFPPESQATPMQMQQLVQAFRDAIELARFIAVTFDECTAGRDIAFQRYFRPTDSLFVQNIFRTIANIDLDIVISQENVLPLMFTDLNPMFSEKLSISLGDHPEIGLKACLTTGISRSLAYQVERPDGTCFISICDAALSFPSLKDIIEPPNWAQGEAGYTCDGLGDHDTDFMFTAGSSMLHELIHWGYLFREVPQFYNIQEPHEGGRVYIPDWSGPNPPMGYGCLYSKWIRDDLGGGFSALHNVDNYVCYAISKYWSWKCQKIFGPSQEFADSYRRYNQLFVPPILSDTELGPAPDSPPPR